MEISPHSSDKELSDISSLQTPDIVDVPFHLIAAHERKTTKLLKNSSEQQSIRSKNGYFPFSFEYPVFLHSVRINVQEFVEGSKFEYIWEGVDGRRHNGDAYLKSDEIYIPIRGLAKSIAFKPPRAYFTKPYINSVELIGFEISQAGDFIDFASSVSELQESASAKIIRDRAALDEERGKVNALQAQRGSLQQDIDALKSAMSREQGKLKRVETQRDEAMSRSAELARSIADEEARLDSIKSNVSRASVTRSRLAKNIGEKDEKLRELQSNIHLFPSELSDFSRQGAKDSKAFFLLSLIPSTIIAIMFYLLVKGAADLTTKITGEEYVNLPALAVSRAPYVAISCAIITISYYLAKMLILEMIRISRQRLALTKISIIAKDISSSVDADLSLSDEERYQRRIALKMDMMKNHLQEYLSSDFAPTLPKGIIPSLASVGIPSLKKTQADTEKETNSVIE